MVYLALLVICMLILVAVIVYAGASAEKHGE